MPARQGGQKQGSLSWKQQGEERDASAQGHLRTLRWRAQALCPLSAYRTGSSPSARAPLTAGLDLPHVVAGKPASPAVVRALPPAAFLHPRDMDDVSFRKGELVFIGLLEVELGSHYQLVVAIVSHVLKKERRRRKISWRLLHIKLDYV